MSLSIIAGPSGVGKTVVQELLSQRYGFQKLMTNTSRPKRPNEMNCENPQYHFWEKKDFENAISNGCFFEYNIISGNYYGTTYKDLNEAIESSTDYVLIVEVNGLVKIKESFPNVKTIFLMPTSIEELERRIRSRGTEEEEDILTRLSLAKKEISFVTSNLENTDIVNKIIVNDDLDICVSRVYSFIKN